MERNNTNTKGFSKSSSKKNNITLGVKSKVKLYVSRWEKRCYNKGIPDEAPIEIFDKVPSYKKIAMCLLNNDLNLTGLGFSEKKSKYYSILKQIELKDRNYIGKQTTLF